MSTLVTPTVSSATPGPAARRVRRLHLHPADLAVPTSVGLWIWSVVRIDPGRLGAVGLVGALPVTYFVSLGIVALSAVWWLTAERRSPVRLAVHVAALAVFLYGTAPLIYLEPRNVVLFRHVGVVQYIAAHGAVAANVDIYQEWPGFFALAAWFDRVAGLSSPLPVAAWSELVFGLLACVVVAFALRQVRLGWRERWLALLLFTAANWVDQTFFSPQAMGFVVGVGVVAMALHWFRADVASAWWGRASRRFALVASRLPRLLRTRAGVAPPVDPPAPPASVGVVVAVLGVTAALVVAHELSPYIIVLQLGALTLAGRLRPAWLAPAMLAMALLFLAPRFGFVNREFGLLSSLGHFFLNLRPRRVGQPVLGTRLASDATMLLSASVSVLALAGMWRRRRAGRPTATLAVLAVSPLVLAGALSYGAELVWRAYLFSLPWSAALAASAVWRRAGSRARRMVAPGTALVLLLALFVPSYFGFDNVTTVAPQDVAASRYLTSHGRPGYVVLLDHDFPSQLDARYLDFPQIALLDNATVPRAFELNAAAVPAITYYAQAGAGDGHFYFVVSQRMLDYAVAFGLTPSKSPTALEAALDRSPTWQIFYDRDGTRIYERATGALAAQSFAGKGFSAGPAYLPGTVRCATGTYMTVATYAETEQLLRSGLTVYYEPRVGDFRAFGSLQELADLEGGGTGPQTTTWVKVAGP